MTALAARALPKYQVMPALTPDEEEWLRNDIQLHGVLVPVEVDENGDILDGHHRKAIADALGKYCPTRTRTGLTEAEKLEHVVSLNVVRRQLSGHDRQAVIARLRSEGLSLRAIGRAVGVGLATVHRSLAGVPDGTPDTDHVPDPPPTPLPTVPTVSQKAAELRSQGLPQRAIANQLGIAQSKVSDLLNPASGRVAHDVPVEWPATRSLIAELRSFASTDARRVAASVPDRNRAATARQLREVGTFLGSIALELERSQR